MPTVAAQRRPGKKSPKTAASATPKATKGELSRLHLLQAAARVFRAKGFADATIRDIAQEAGIALGGLYFHFRSKQEFIGAVLTHGMVGINRDVHEAVAALPPGSTGRQRIETACRAQMEAARRHGEFMSIRRMTGEMTREGWLEFTTARESYRQLWKSLVTDAQKSGELRDDVDATTVVFFVLGAHSWMDEWYDPARNSADRILRDFATLFFDGAAPGETAGLRRPRRT